MPIYISICIQYPYACFHPDRHSYKQGCYSENYKGCFGYLFAQHAEFLAVPHKQQIIRWILNMCE